MTTTLAALVRDCAVKSIHTTVAAIDAFSTDYAARVTARRSRLAVSTIVATRLTAGATLTSIPLSTDRSTVYVALAVNQIEATIAAVASLIKTTAATQRATILAMPDALVAMANSLGTSSPSLPSASTICARVDDVLRPQLALVSQALATTHLEADARLQALDHQLQKLEAAMAGR